MDYIPFWLWFKFSRFSITLNSTFLSFCVLIHFIDSHYASSRKQITVIDALIVSFLVLPDILDILKWFNIPRATLKQTWADMGSETLASWILNLGGESIFHSFTLLYKHSSDFLFGKTSPPFCIILLLTFSTPILKKGAGKETTSNSVSNYS